jgi:hypothetical protein
MPRVCVYCRSKNNMQAQECVSCGAPLPIIDELSGNHSATKLAYSKPIRNHSDASVELATKAVSIYGNVILSIIQAIIIAAVALAIGLAGAILDFPVVGLLGALLLGLCVGISINTFLLTVLGPTGGLLLGSLASIFASLCKLPVFTYLLFLIIIPCFTTLMGSPKLPYRLRTRWQKIRIFLGAAGGLLFGLIGMLIGSGLYLVYTNWLVFLQ